MKRIRGFDGLRVIAVLLVLLEHRSPLSTLHVGHFGVWIFFCISGFLILNILHKDRMAIENGASFLRTAWTFQVRRAQRIFPAYYGLLTMLLLISLHLGLPTNAFPWHFAYLSNFYIAFEKQSWIGGYSHLWSLAVEEQFYLVAGVLFLLVPAVHHLQCLMALFIAGTIAILSMPALGFSAEILYTLPLTNMAYMVAGGVLALHLKAEHSGQPSNRFRLPSVFACLLLALVLLGVLDERTEAAHEVARWMMTGLLSSTAIVLFVVRRQDSLIVRWLEWAPLVYLGKISYGFYLFHNFVPSPAAFIGARLSLAADHPLAWSGGLLFCFVASTLLAALSWHFYERWFLELGASRKTSIRPDVLPAAQPFPSDR